MRVYRQAKKKKHTGKYENQYTETLNFLYLWNQSIYYEIVTKLVLIDGQNILHAKWNISVPKIINKMKNERF